jgi:hypothetical protein
MTVMNKTKQIRELSKKLQEDLKAKNMELDIVHNRLMDGFVVVDPNDGSLDDCLNRHEFYESVNNLTYRADYYNSAAMKFGNFAKPTGGFTKVYLRTPNGEVLVGKHNFGRNAHFFKAEGVLRATYDALKHVEKTDE